MAKRRLPLVKVDFRPQLEILQGWRTLALRFEKLVQTRYSRLAAPIKKRVLIKAKTKPQPLGYPPKRRWSSRRQQRAFFASGGFGQGVPTVRTDDYVNAMDVTMEVKGFEGFFVLTNSDPGAPYIGGDEQQPFIIDVGWLKLDSIAEEESAPIADLLIDQYFLLLDPTAEIR